MFFKDTLTFYPSGDVKLLLNYLVHAMPRQCMLALSVHAVFFMLRFCHQSSLRKSS